MEGIESFVEEYSPAVVSEKLREALNNEEFRAAFDRELNMLNYDVPQVLEESFLDTIEEQTREQICAQLESIYQSGHTKESVRGLALLFK